MCVCLCVFYFISIQARRKYYKIHDIRVMYVIVTCSKAGVRAGDAALTTRFGDGKETHSSYSIALVVVTAASASNSNCERDSTLAIALAKATAAEENEG